MGDILDIIRQKANDHEAEVPADAWERLQNRRKRRPLAFWFIAASVLLLLTTSGILFFNREKSIAVSQSAAEKESADDLTGSRSGKKSPSSTTPNSEGVTQYVTTDTEVSTIVKESEITHGDEAFSSPKSKATGSARQQWNLESGIPEPGIEESGSVQSGITELNKQKRTKHSKGRVNALTEEAAIADDGFMYDADVVKKLEPNIRSAALLPSATNQSISLKRIHEISPGVHSLHSDPLHGKKQKSGSNHSGAWYLDFSLSPVLALSSYQSGLNFARSQTLSNGVSTFNGTLSESYINPSVAYQFSVRRSFKNGTGISVGLQYLQQKEYIRINGTQTSTLINTGQPHLNPNEGNPWVTDTTASILKSNDDISLVNRYQYWSIPVSFQYAVSRIQNWELSIESGLLFHISSRYQNRINDANLFPLLNTSQALPSKTNLGVFLQAGLRAQRDLSKHWSFFTLPQLGISLVNQQFSNALMQKRVHRFGIQAGISYRF